MEITMGFRNGLKRIYARLGQFENLPIQANTAADEAEASFDSQRKIITLIGSKRYEIISDDDYLKGVGPRFEPDMVRLFDSLTKEDHCVFDIGANIGCTAVFFGEKAAQVHCFEPSPTTFGFLAKNVGNAGLENVICVNVGLGKAETESELTFAPNNRSGGFVSNQIQASAGHVVEKIRIVRGDDYVRLHRISRLDFIKIDVEGFEKDVIEGMLESVEKFRPVVALELNHWCLNVFQRISVPDFLDFLRGIFPILYAVDGDDVRDLHNPNEAYFVMYSHIILGFKYPTIVGAFNRDQLGDFSRIYKIPVH
jgi:FkbM family methyltransferase